ncbi:MAG: hypothetical protein K9M10_02485 [Candidatus Pacebacteria bacterium]|nr:hypothetical protein [Candidatus Paceibacterota bacterium]MCF7857323.1 hypothetical protein [Candidatus Paceibacterota bacterium]
MEITRQEAEILLKKRLLEYPQCNAIVSAQSFKKELLDILEFESVDVALYESIENEVMLVLTFYSPLFELTQHIQESTSLSLETSEHLATLIETLVLSPVIDDLQAFEYLWKKELEENTSLPDVTEGNGGHTEHWPKGESSPIGGGGVGPKPLTREEVLKALAPNRTMASDSKQIKGTDTKTENTSAATHDTEEKSS